MKSWKWVASALLLAIVASGCGGQIEPGVTSGAAPTIKGLGLQRIEMATLPQGERFVGTLESSDRGQLAARLDGRVAKVLVRNGEQVRRGQLLLTLTDSQAGDHLGGAEASLAAAQSRQAGATARLELATTTAERYRQLFENQAVTPQEMDRVKAELEEARQAEQAARAAIDGAVAGRGAARTALSWTQVTAPYDAVVVSRQVEVGSTVLPGTPLLILDRQGAWQVRAVIPESRIGAFRLGQQVQVEIPARGLRLAGEVMEIGSAVDAGSRSAELKVALAAVPGLAAGLFARVEVPTAASPALLVPAAALVERGQLHGVFVVDQGLLHFRLVRIGRAFDGKVEILSGLQGGETIVIEGVERAKNGARTEG